MARKVLLVDDEKDILTIMGKRIKDWGYDLIKASSGGEAIEALKSQNPDIVVLDYVMPTMDGLNTLKEMRKFNKTVPVIMFTAYPDGRSIAGAEKLDIFAYIPKVSAFATAETSLKTAIQMAEKNLK